MKKIRSDSKKKIIRTREEFDNYKLRDGPWWDRGRYAPRIDKKLLKELRLPWWDREKVWMFRISLLFIVFYYFYLKYFDMPDIIHFKFVVREGWQLIRTGLRAYTLWLIVLVILAVLITASFYSNVWMFRLSTIISTFGISLVYWNYWSYLKSPDAYLPPTEPCIMQITSHDFIVRVHDFIIECYVPGGYATGPYPIDIHVGFLFLIAAIIVILYFYFYRH